MGSNWGSLTPQNTFNDLLHINNSNSGLGSSLSQIMSGNGNLSNVYISTTSFNIQSGFQLGGSAVSATATQLNLTPILQGLTASSLLGNPTGSSANATTIGLTNKFQFTSGNLDLNMSNLTLGSLGGTVSLTTQVTGTLPIGNGGTGQTTATNAINALLPSQTSLINTVNGEFLYSNGASLAWKYGRNDFDVRNYGAVPDARRISDIVTTNGSATATSASQGNFTVNDVGKKINIYDFVNGVFIFQGSISAVGSTTSITLSGNASANGSSGNLTAWIGTDNATAINNALTAAGAYVESSNIDPNHPLGYGDVVVSFPTDSRGSAYLFNSTLNVPTNVYIDSSAMLINNAGTQGSSNRTWAINMSSGAGIYNLQMDCCQGMGITMGTNGAQSHAYIGNLTLWEVGVNYNGSLTPNSQIGLELQGNDYYINRYWCKGGNQALWANQCNDVRCNQLFLIGASSAAVLYLVEEFACSDMQIDTGSYVGLTIDGSHNVRMNVTNFAINATAETYGLMIGNYSSTASHNLNISYSADRIGNTAVYLQNITDSKFDFNITNASITSGGGTAIATGINYGAGLSGSIFIKANIDTSITTQWTGTLYGALLLNGQLQGPVVGTYASSYTWNLYANPLLSLTLTGNITLNNPTVLQPGIYTITLIQNSTGGYTVTWGSVFNFSGGTAPTVTTTANKKTICQFYCDGTKMNLLNTTNNLS